MSTSCLLYNQLRVDKIDYVSAVLPVVLDITVNLPDDTRVILKVWCWCSLVKFIKLVHVETSHSAWANIQLELIVNIFIFLAAVTSQRHQLCDGVACASTLFCFLGHLSSLCAFFFCVCVSVCDSVCVCVYTHIFIANAFFLEKRNLRYDYDIKQISPLVVLAELESRVCC